MDRIMTQFLVHQVTENIGPFAVGVLNIRFEHETKLKFFHEKKRRMCTGPFITKQQGNKIA
jgi:hypothetical protein